jgi:hypothetical protein
MALAAIPYGLLAAFNLIKSELFSRDVQEKWQFAKINPWPWWAWLLMTMAIVVGVTLEGAYRVVRKREKDIALLSNKIAELADSEFKARAEFLRRSTEIVSLQSQIRSQQAENDYINGVLNCYYELCGDTATLRYRVARLAHDLYSFIAAKGPVPRIPKGATQKERQDFIFSVMVPFSQKLHSSFTLHFPERLALVRDQLADAGFTDFELNKAIGLQAHGLENIGSIADRLLEVGKWMDIRKNHERTGIEEPYT